jgi:hypothetical protein
MKKYIFAALAVLMTYGLTSCDDGRIPEKAVSFKQGRVVKLTGDLTGLRNWPDQYSVALAGFDGTDEYAVISKAISKSTEGSTSIVLSGITDKVTTVHLCILDRLRREVMSFKDLDLEQTSDTIYMEVGNVDVSMFNAIQQSYFNTTCANCHGASNRAAAGLYLTEGRSYAAMVGVPSVKIDTLKIAEPGNAEKSQLHIILHQDNVEGISMTHRDLVSEKNEQSILPLIDKWIDNGAKKD